ncbi:heavy metal tolerance protein [Paraphaeosphaeria minitans]|uniref:Heavy metal tolerance protein n=1 Tax=Paraphaeosphaeria minitans TaxID=565426 RepID=A0A9P6G6C8_9PLEO|nr:heavy metal tolerance protein [Paraphaeosphaeria minitans]
MQFANAALSKLRSNNLADPLMDMVQALIIIGRISREEDPEMLNLIHGQAFGATYLLGDGTQDMLLLHLAKTSLMSRLPAVSPCVRAAHLFFTQLLISWGTCSNQNCAVVHWMGGYGMSITCPLPNIRLAMPAAATEARIVAWGSGIVAAATWPRYWLTDAHSRKFSLPHHAVLCPGTENFDTVAGGEEVDDPKLHPNGAPQSVTPLTADGSTTAGPGGMCHQKSHHFAQTRVDCQFTQRSTQWPDMTLHTGQLGSADTIRAHAPTQGGGEATTLGRHPVQTLYREDGITFAVHIESNVPRSEFKNFPPLNKATTVVFEMQISYGAFLHYTYAAAIVLGFSLVFVYSLCTLERPVRMRLKKRSPVVLYMLVIASSYVLQDLFYQRPTDDNRLVPHLSVALVWTALVIILLGTETLLWKPYVGVFFLGLLFESIATALLLATQIHPNTVSLCLIIGRLTVTLTLSINGFLLLLSYRAETHSDEEAQLLLGLGNADTPQQLLRKRLAEPRNGIEYLQSFAMVMPHLFPWNSKVRLYLATLYLATRVVVLVLGRGVNVATPKLLGIVVDKIDRGLGTMPWKHIAFWACCVWLDGRAGLSALDSFARHRIHNSSNKRVRG